MNNKQTKILEEIIKLIIEFDKSADLSEPYIENLSDQLKNYKDRDLSIDNIYINNLYNKTYWDNRLCKCWHEYYRHFDTYDDMYSVWCKYCWYGWDCNWFEEA